jgi:NO-binding membrane sensor protein with MHYT domain
VICRYHGPTTTVTLSLAQRLRPTDGARATHQPLYWPWIVGGAFSMGIGIWSMHFIGMLAFDLPVQVVYDLRLTAMSYVIAVVVSGFALYCFRHIRLRSFKAQVVAIL